LERYFFCVTKEGPQPALGSVESEFRDDQYLRQFWQDVVKGLRGAPVADLRDVVQSYEGAKRRLYHKAMLSYYMFGIDERHARLKSFVKFEKQSLDKAPRVINPRTPVYNLLLAAYVKFAEKRIYERINGLFGEHTTHTVIKGINMTQQAGVLRSKWDRFVDPVCVGLDATKFDMHVSKWCLAYEHMFYLGIHSRNNFERLWDNYSAYLRSRTPHSLKCDYDALRNGERIALKWLLKQQVFNVGKAYFPDGTLRFKMTGTRSSGDINTSLGNCIIMCSLIFGWLQQVGVDAELGNNGDDCVVIMERRDLLKFQVGLEDYFARKGFRMEVEEPVFEFEEIEFCQSHPVWNGECWTMVRNLETSIIKNAMCLIPVQNQKVFRKWLGAVGQCEGSLNVGIPVLQEFAAMYRRLGNRASAKFIGEVYRGTTRVHHATKQYVERQITPEARSSFFFAFGVRPDDQVQLESYFRSFVYDDIVTPVPACEARDKPLFFVPHVMRLVTPLN
jgi:hypothetical protein